MTGDIEGESDRPREKETDPERKRLTQRERDRPREKETDPG
jgi:hypothetical protein